MGHRPAHAHRSIPLALALLMLTLPLAPVAQSESPVTAGHAAGTSSVLFSENFESGAASGWSLSGLWRVTDCNPVTGGFSLAYNKPGCPTDFDTNARTVGSAITPMVKLPASAGALQLQYVTKAKTDNLQFLDTMLVHVSANGGPWDALHQEPRGISMIGHTVRLIDLTPYAGQDVRIRFEFDSVSTNWNDGWGWYVDDVRIVQPTLGALWKDTFNDGTSDGWSLDGLWHVDDCRAHTVKGLAFTKGAKCNSYETPSSGTATSPWVTIPAGVAFAQLRYGQYFEIVSEWGAGNAGGDAFVNVVRPDGSWVRLHDEQGPWAAFSTRILDLAPFAGETVRFEFIVTAQGGAPWDGWFVDDVQVLVPGSGIVDPPSQPVDVGFTQRSGTTDLTVTWKAPRDSSYVPVTDYRVYREGPTGKTLLAVLPGSARSFDDAPATSSSWLYSVTATTHAGTSEEALARVRAPQAPRDLTARPGLAPGTVALDWEEPPQSSTAFKLTHYRVYVDDGGGFELAGTTPASRTDYTFIGTDVVNALRFEVRAAHAVTSPPSDVACTRALSVAPQCEPLVVAPETPEPPRGPFYPCGPHGEDSCIDYPPTPRDVECQWFPPLPFPCVQWGLTTTSELLAWMEENFAPR